MIRSLWLATNLEPLENRRLLSAGLTAVADFNGDDRADAFTVESVATGSQGKFRVTTSHGNGHGGFAVSSVRELGMVKPLAAVAGDFLNDGTMDQIIVTPQTTAIGSPLTAHIALTWQGQFFHLQSHLWNSNGQGVTNGSWGFAPFDPDSLGDLIRLDQIGWVDVYRNSGCFTFDGGSFRFPVFTAGNARELALGDFNNDGFGDMAAITNAGVQFAQSSGNICSPPTTIDVGRGTPSTLAAADVNGDGRDDLIAGFADGSVRTLLQTANGTFGGTIHSRGAISSESVRLHAGDIDGDGDADLFANKATAVNEFATARGNGRGTFSSITVGKVREMNVLENQPSSSPQNVLS
jgi:hypothetical protein